jgi:hypothetical protein
LHNSNVSSFSLPISASVIISRFEEKGEIPKVGDIWIPKGYTFPNCFIIFFIPGIEKLFQDGDIILKVEIGGGTSRLINWRLCVKSNQGIKWQLESVNE